MWCTNTNNKVVVRYSYANMVVQMGETKTGKQPVLMSE